MVIRWIILLMFVCTQFTYAANPQRISILSTTSATTITHGSSGAGRFASFCADGSSYSYRPSPKYGQRYNYLLPGSDVNIKIVRTDGRISSMSLSKAMSGESPILRGNVTENVDVSAYEEFVLSLNPEQKDIEYVEIERVKNPLTFANDPKDTKDLLVLTIVDLFGYNLSQEEFWICSDLLSIAHERLAKTVMMSPLQRLDAISLQHLKAILLQPDFKTLPKDSQIKLLESTDILLTSAGVFSESSIRYIRIVKNFSDWGLWTYEPVFKEVLVRFQSEQKLKETGTIDAETRAKINDLTSIQRSAEQYQVSPRFIYELAREGKIRQNGGALTPESVPWLLAFERIEKIFVLNYRSGLPREFLMDIKSFQTTYGLTLSGFPDSETLHSLDQYLDLATLARSYRNGKDVPEVLAGFSETLILKKNGITYFYSPGFAKAWSILDSPAIEKEEEYFRNHIKRLAGGYPEVTFVALGSRSDQNIKIQFNDVERVISWVNTSDLSPVIDSFGELLKDHPLDRPIVVSRDFLTRGKLGNTDEIESSILKEGYVNDRQWINCTVLLKELKRKFPTRRFYLGTGSSQDNAGTQIRTIKSSQEVSAIVSPQSFGIQYESVNRMKSHLVDASIKVHELDDNFANVPVNIFQSNLIIVSGHKDKNYIRYLKRLARAGLLEDKVVIIFSCNEMGTANLNSELIADGYAHNIIFFPTRLNVSATNAVLKALAAIVKTLNGAEGISAELLLQKSVENAMADPANEDLLAELRPFLQYLNQTSFNFIKQGRNSHGYTTY